MDRKYLENLINKFEKSLSETERMSNSLIELSDVLSKLDTSISKVDKSIETIYENSEIQLLTEKSIDAVSSLQLVKKQSMDILKNIKSFKDLQNDLCKVQKEVNEEYNSLIELNKEKLIKTIVEYVTDKKIEGISNINDESDRHGMRIVIDVKKDANPQVVLNSLYKHTNLQVSDGIILLALVGTDPKVLNLKEILVEYHNHQRDVITRRTRFDLDKAL